MLLVSSLQAQEKSEVYNPAYPSSAKNDGLYILTPLAKAEPQINGASVFGVRPGSPFLYTIPATGIRPMTYDVENLPAGLSVDSETGMISGKIQDLSKKDYTLTLVAKNKKGKDEKSFVVKVGNTICLTPPLGWNAWNCQARESSQDKVLKSARAMVSKGLINYGWTYVNLDGYWQGDTRGGKYNALEPDFERFPDIKGMFDEIHSLGLKCGMYSTPWITSYAKGIGGSSDNKEGKWDDSMLDPKGTQLRDSKWRRVGKYSFAENDVKQWVEWGIDYLKYDWQPIDSASLVEMADALDTCGRDIVYSISNNTTFKVVDLVKTRVNCFRTGVDLKDRWDTDGQGWNIIQEWEKQNKWLEVYRGEPGHFTDPDMLVVGKQIHNRKLVPTTLTADEQYSHITLWTLWASPMLIGCPIDQMDDFTLNLFTNAEVIDIHQDATAVGGIPVYQKDGIEIVVKDLENGEKAIGLFNKNESEQVVTMDWETVGLEGKKKLRDVWRNKDIGAYEDSFSASVRSHGVVLLRVE
nr:putative Ig domain-containing protein [uncultured Draconibacterium sp.]